MTKRVLGHGAKCCEGDCAPCAPVETEALTELAEFVDELGLSDEDLEEDE